MAEIFNFEIPGGADTTQPFEWRDSDDNPINLTGYTAEMQLKQTITSDAALTLSTGNGKISLGGVAGTITVHFTSTDTDDLTAYRYFYDLEVTSGASVVTRVVQGEIFINPQVTR